MKIESEKFKNVTIGFYPPFVNLSDSGRTILIAKRYRELGGKAIFFSNGGKYEFLAEKNGFDLIKVEPEMTDKQRDIFFKVVSGERVPADEFLEEKWLTETVAGQIKAFKKTGIKALVTANNVSCALSTRAANVTYINIMPACGACRLKFPEDLENIFTRLVPQKIKMELLNWIFVTTKRYLKQINRVGKKFDVPPFKNSFDLFKGDISFMTNALVFLTIFRYHRKFPDEDYIGMILIEELFEEENKSKESQNLDKKIRSHIKRPGKSILLSLGSSGTKDIYLKILDALNQTNYNVVASHAGIFDDNFKPNYNDNILLVKYIPNIRKINELVDLAILHGGQGTVYTAVYSKKPMIGIPMHIEQHLNLERIVGHGMGLMLSKKYFTKEKLFNAINEIFNNYEKYHNNAIQLGNKMPPPEGDKKAAKRLVEIANNL